jgi:anti-sigma B factor antagonist
MFQHSKVGAIDVISGSIPLDAKNINSAEATCALCFEKGQPRMVFNLEGIALIDSKGLEFMLQLRDQCQHRGGTIHLAAPNPLCCDILQATGLTEQFTLFDDVNSAVGSFSQ